jgi:hypothetical protein
MSRLNPVAKYRVLAEGLSTVVSCLSQFPSRRVFAILPAWQLPVPESRALLSMPGIGFSKFRVIFWLIMPRLASFAILGVERISRSAEISSKFRQAVSISGAAV